jgi:uncharacterized protein YciI
MYYLVLIRYCRPLEDVVAATDDHRSYLRELHAQGILLASGPFDPRTGGAMLVRVPEGDPAAVEAIRDGDPYWQRGLAEYELLRWAPTIGAEALAAL